MMLPLTKPQQGASRAVWAAVLLASTGLVLRCAEALAAHRQFGLGLGGAFQRSSTLDPSDRRGRRSWSWPCRGSRVRLGAIGATDDEGQRERVYEVCKLDPSGEITECTVVSASDLRDEVGDSYQGVLDKLRTGEELLFRVPSAVEGEADALLTVADFATCVVEETCEVPDDVLNKAFGPDVVMRIKLRQGCEGTSISEEEQEALFTQLEEERRDSEAAGVSADAAASTPSALSTVFDAVEAVDQPSQSAARYHLHFGAGRLGLGLVVPAIAASGLPFAVVQRPKPRWQKMFEKGEKTNTVDVAVNHEVKVRQARVISTADEALVPENMPAQSLVFGSTRDNLDQVLFRATSFSCSLGSAMMNVMTTTLQVLPEVISEAEFAAQKDAAARRARLRKRRALFNANQPAQQTTTEAQSKLQGTPRGSETVEAPFELDPATDPRPVLFCAENDHAAVMKLKQALRTRVRVVDCMVDRVCMGRKIEPDGVEIEAEPWDGSIVVLEPGFTQRQVPFSPMHVTLPASTREADYLSERKFSLVNGMHTVLAFVTLVHSYSHVDPGREYVLDKYDEMSRSQQRPIEAWRAARIANLIHKFGMEALTAWTFPKTDEEAAEPPEAKTREEDVWDALLDFSDTVLSDRFSAVDDLVSRVLGGGVKNRYHTRLLPIYQWVARRAAVADRLQSFADHEDHEERRPPADDREEDAIQAFLGYAMERDRAKAIDREVHRWIEEPFASAADAEAHIHETCGALVRDARRFCNKEVEITHKLLIKEQRAAGGKKYSPKVQRAQEEQASRTTQIQTDREAARQQRLEKMRQDQHQQTTNQDQPTA